MEKWRQRIIFGATGPLIFILYVRHGKGIETFLREYVDYAYSNTCLITSLLWNIGGVKCIKNFV